MFDVGFSEILVICALALIVLGPQKLPRIAAGIGRWVGRARSMARQFREQLEREANELEESGKTVRDSVKDVASSFSSAVKDVETAASEGLNPTASTQSGASGTSTPDPGTPAPEIPPVESSAGDAAGTPHLDLTPTDFPPANTAPQDYSHLGAARGGPSELPHPDAGDTPPAGEKH